MSLPSVSARRNYEIQINYFRKVIESYQMKRKYEFRMLRMRFDVQHLSISEENVCKFIYASAYPHKCNMNFELVFSRLFYYYAQSFELHLHSQAAMPEPFSHSVTRSAAAIFSHLVTTISYILLHIV